MSNKTDKQLLDKLWEKNQKLFLELWEEGISTGEMVFCLKLSNPEVYQEILEELGFNMREEEV